MDEKDGDKNLDDDHVEDAHNADNQNQWTVLAYHIDHKVNIPLCYVHKKCL